MTRTLAHVTIFFFALQESVVRLQSVVRRHVLSASQQMSSQIYSLEAARLRCDCVRSSAEKNHFEELTCIQIGHRVFARLALGGRAPIFYCVRTPFEDYENLWKIVSQRARRLNLNTGMSVAPVTSRCSQCFKPHTNLSLQFRLEKMPPPFGHAAGPEQPPEMQNQQQSGWEEQPAPEEQQRESQPEEQQQQWQQQQQQQQQQQPFSYLNFY